MGKTIKANLNHKYTIRVTPFNDQGEEGATSATVVVSINSTDLGPPEPPVSIESRGSDREITLIWDASPTFFTTQYRIYRKIGEINFNASSWTAIDTLPKDILTFTNFGLDNDQIYSYYITSIDVYGRESRHLPDSAINLNFIEEIPRSQGTLTEPDSVELTLINNQVVITWESLLEEFDAFTIFRSIGNLHSWQSIAEVDRETFFYTDITLPLIDGTIFYYMIDKTINDSDLIVQTTDIKPPNSIFLGNIKLTINGFGDIDVSDRRDIKDLVDPLAEFTSLFLLPHRHKDIGANDPTRIDLQSELIITDWKTIDGRIFTTLESDISGTSFVVKVNGRFPDIFFNIDVLTRRLIFAEPIVEVDEYGVPTEFIPDIEVRVLGIEEVQNVLDSDRILDIHARQVQFGSLNREQLPSINHEGRIREPLLPDRFLLERFSNHTFIVPQANTDTTKNFGGGTTFYAVIESDGDIDEIIDWDLQDDNKIVGFRRPSFSPTTLFNLKQIKEDTRIAANNNDAARDSTGSWVSDGGSLSMGNNGDGTTSDIYLRFLIDIPETAVITSARIVFTSSDNNTIEKCRLNIRMLDPADINEATNFALPLSQTINTLGDVFWEVPPWILDEIGGDTTTPDISSLVQTLVDSSVYSAPHHIFFRIINNSLSEVGARREFYFYDGDNN